MFNLLIVEDDFVQAQHLINCICKSLSNIRLYNIISTAKDCIELIKEKPPIDIIILDLNLPDKSGNSIIEYMEKNELPEYKNSIIIQSGYIELINKIRFSPYVFSYSFKGSSIDMLINEIKRLTQEKNQKKKIMFYEKKLINSYIIYILTFLILEQSIFQIVYVMLILFQINTILFFKKTSTLK